jgi:hypothetical protein
MSPDPESSVHDAFIEKETASSLDSAADEEKTGLGVDDMNNDKQTEPGIYNTPPEKEGEAINPPTTNSDQMVTENNISKDGIQDNSFASIRSREGRAARGGSTTDPS